MMKHSQITRSRLLFCLSMLSLSGCIFVGTATPTLLRIKWPNQDDTVLGMRDVKYRSVADQVEIIGYGWHPREHEAYAYFINEGFPVLMDRWIHVVSVDGAKNGNKHRLTMWLNAWIMPIPNDRAADSYFYEYQGLFIPRSSFTLFGRKINLNDVTLTPVGHAGPRIAVSGKVVATKASDQDFDKFWSKLRHKKRG